MVAVQVVDIHSRKGTLVIDGRTADGKTVVLEDSTFRPYFWTDAPVDELNIGVGKNVESARIETTLKMPSGYYCEKPIIVRKVSFSDPAYIAPARNRVLAQFPGARLFEADVPYTMRFLTDRKIGGSAWVQKDETTGRIEPVDEASVAPLTTLSFDIECVGQVVKHEVFDKAGNVTAIWQEYLFPKPDFDPVIQISCVEATVGTSGYTGRIFMVGTTANPRINVKGPKDFSDLDAEVLSFATEREMLVAFMRYLAARNFDVLSGYNILGFDLPYLFDRAAALTYQKNAVDLADFARWGRDGSMARWGKKLTKSRGRGTEEVPFVEISGRVVLDVLDLTRRGEKRRDYSLDAVAGDKLKARKASVHHSEIGRLFVGSDEDRERLAYYCLLDSLLSWCIASKTQMLMQAIQMARATDVTLNEVLHRGVSLRVFGPILRAFGAAGYVIPMQIHGSDEDEDDGTKMFKGAVVMEPVPGFYVDPTITLDFASLYPSIMMAHNLCYTTLIYKSQLHMYRHVRKYTSPTGHTFVTPDVKEGLLPAILKRMLGERAAANRAKAGWEWLVDVCVLSLAIVGGLDDTQAAELALKIKPVADGVGLAEKLLGESRALIEKHGGDAAAIKAVKSNASFQKDVQDGRQLALKVVCNTVYGFTGASRGRMPSVEISETVTARGREMIMHVKKRVEELVRPYIEEHCPGRPVEGVGCQVLYGDSVSAETPCLLRAPDGRVVIRRIDEVGEAWVATPDGKEVGTTAYEAWSDVGWTPIRWVFRHRTDKKMYRVTTGAGDVCVTADHSLLRPDGEAVKPCEVVAGTRLMHAPWPAEAREHVVRDLKHYQDNTLAVYECALAVISERNQITAADEAIVQIRPYDAPPDAYVYDFETANHHFHAGVGRMIVHNTDSVMIRVPNISVAEAVALGRYLAAEITKDFLPPIKLAWEKILMPYLLLAKKRYGGGFWLVADIMKFVKISGLESVRRDTFQYQRETIEGIFDILMKKCDLAAAVAYAKERIARLWRGEVPTSELVITAGIQKEFDEYKTKPAQVALAARIEARNPGHGPRPGSRVPYVYVHARKDAKKADRVEDPVYALKNDIPLDYQEMVRKLKKPILRVLFFVEDIEQKLFTGDHLRAVRIPTLFGIGKRMATVRDTCVKCRGPLDGDKLVCMRCKPERAHIALEYEKKQNEAIAEEAAVQKTCWDCSGEGAKMCANSSCNNFYLREDVAVKARRAKACLARLSW